MKEVGKSNITVLDACHAGGRLQFVTYKILLLKLNRWRSAKKL